MTVFMDLNWQEYEIEREEPAIDSEGKQIVGEDGKPVVNMIPTGVKMEIKPLNYEANQKMLAFAQKNSSSTGDDEEDGDANIKRAFDTMSSPDLHRFIKEIVPPHVRNFQGVELIREGETERRIATIDDIVENGCFMTISLSIFTKLSLISNLSEVENDSLKKSLPGLSEGNK